MSRRPAAALLTLLLALSACTGASEDGGAADIDLAVRDQVELPAVGATPVTASLPGDVEVVGLDEVEPVPLADLGSWVDAGVEDGLFTEAEGLTAALRYLAGDTPAEELPGVTEVATLGGTGLVQRAGELVDAGEVDGVLADELARLVQVFSPRHADLDAVSVARDEAGDLEGAATSIPLAMGTGPAGALAAGEIEIDRNCADLAAVGFVEAGGHDDTCLVYDEEVVGEHPQRVYYPLAWVDDDTKQQAITTAMDALVDSANRYGELGDHEAVSLVFSLLPSPVEGTEGVIGDFVGEACPITVFRAAASSGVDEFKQVVAHEAFHCFQEWNFTNEPVGPNAWWIEGSAEYFSNVVYPSVDGEHYWIDAFDQRSLTAPLWDMKYETTVFFQHLANNIGDDAVIDTLEQLGAAGGGSASADVLNGTGDMRTIFNELVVTWMSDGVADTGGSRIKPGMPTTRKRMITAEDQYEFDTQPFVATRWSLDYEQKHRFEQQYDDGGALHGFVVAEARENRQAWTLLPAEVRSSCKDDDRNFFVTTTVDQDRTFTIDVTDKERGVCDPCLLGAWAMQLEDFEAAMNQVIAQAPGGMPPGAAGAGFAIPGGGYYFEFEDGGTLVSQRNGLQMQVGSAAGSITFVIDGQGSGEYETDGEVLTVNDFTQLASRVRSNIGPMSIDQRPEATTFTIFGQSMTIGEGAEEARPDDNSVPYTCEGDLLTIETEVGPMDLDRIDEMPDPEALEDTDPS